MIKVSARAFNYINILVGVFFSLLVIQISAGWQILRPSYAGWLSVGDGRGIISWDFFRNTPFPEWIMGQIPSYGLEMSRPVLYHLPVLYMYPMRIISPIMGDEFQFIGWTILLNLFLQYYFASKLIRIYFTNKVLIIAGSILFTLSPFMLDRFIIHDHYFLISHWLILAAFYLVIKRDISHYKWALLLIASLLIFPYFTGMVLVMYLIYITYCLLLRVYEPILIIKNLLSTSISMFVTLILMGYLKDSSSSGDSGLGLFRANIHTFFDSSGWSRVIPDLPETYGDYEGFAFLGISFLIMLAFSFLAIFSSKNRGELTALLRDLLPLIISTFLLFIFSLSTDIVFGVVEIFDFSYPRQIEAIAATFRSTGRFAWPLAYLLMLISFITFFRLVKFKYGYLLVVLLLLIQFLDSYPRISFNKASKFSAIYENSLKSEFWMDVKDCYSAIHQLPAVLASEFHYDFAKIAAKNDLAIFPGPLNRFSDSFKNDLIRESRNLVRIGSYDPNRLYVLREANHFQLSEFKLDQNLAINTLNNNDRAGIIDEFLVIAPNVLTCESFYSKHKDLLPISGQSDYLKSESAFDFTTTVDRKYLLNGWSGTEEWGTWTEGNWVGMFFELAEPTQFEKLEINGHGFKWPNGYLPIAKVNINGNYIGELKPVNKKESDFIFTIKDIVPKSNKYYIEFIFETTASPAELGMSDDTRNLGFLFKKLSLK